MNCIGKLLNNVKINLEEEYMKSAAFIQKIQEKSTNIWPAESNYFNNGWIIRLDRGTTYRANSVLPLNYWGENTEEDVVQVEKIYFQHELTSKFQLHDTCSPASLESVLKNRKYEVVMPTAVMGSPIADLNEIHPNNNISVKSVSIREPFWFNSLQSFSPTRTPENMMKIGEIMDRIKIPQKRFFFASNDEKILGVMLAVVDSHYLCLLNLAVDPDFRRLGIASSIVGKSIEWGIKVGAKDIFLQVEHNNEAALKFYSEIGLEIWYSYRYYELRT